VTSAFEEIQHSIPRVSAGDIIPQRHRSPGNGQLASRRIFLIRKIYLTTLGVARRASKRRTFDYELTIKSASEGQ